jgi:cell division septal protein FtsQ
MINFLKRKKKVKQPKTKKLRVYKVNTHKKAVIALWMLLIASFCFAEDYYSWQPSQASIENRNEAIKKYLTEELQTLNVDTIRRDIPTNSTVQDVEIWSVKQAEEK